VGSEKILIVDDHPINLKLARLILEAEGYTIRTAADADATMHVLSEYSPDMILMDLQLPGVDGFELTRRLKADPAWSGILVVALTAFAMKGDEERARAAGCDGYITKPVDSERLPRLVAGYLAAGRAA